MQRILLVLVYGPGLNRWVAGKLAWLGRGSL